MTQIKAEYVTKTASTYIYGQISDSFQLIVRYSIINSIFSENEIKLKRSNTATPVEDQYNDLEKN